MVFCDIEYAQMLLVSIMDAYTLIKKYLKIGRNINHKSLEIPIFFLCTFINSTSQLIREYATLVKLVEFAKLIL